MFKWIRRFIWTGYDVSEEGYVSYWISFFGRISIHWHSHKTD